MNKEIKECLITKEDLTLWIDRPPSNDDLDLCEYLENAVKLKYEFGARIDKAIDLLNNEYESCKGALTNPEHTIVSKHKLLESDINTIRKVIEILKGEL